LLVYRIYSFPPELTILTRRFLNAVAGCLILCAVVALVAISPAHADTKEEQKRKQIKQLVSESQQLKKVLADFKSRRSTLQTALQKSETEIGSIQARTQEILQEIKSLQTDLSDLRHRRDNLTEKKQQQQVNINRQILSAYQLGKQKKLKILLNQEQPEKISRAMAYYDYFNRARNEQIDAFIDLLEALDQLEPKIQQKAQSLAQTQEQLKT